MKEVSTIGLDLAKTVFQVHGVDAAGRDAGSWRDGRGAMIAEPLAFPAGRPAGFAPIEGEPVYDPARHLALAKPADVLRLGALGYGRAAIAACPSDFAISAPFRLLSDEGVAAVAAIARQLEQYAIHGRRVAKMVRGGVYRSQFLRDFATCPVVSGFLSEIFEAPVAPHTMPMHLAHLNYAPDDLDQPVDKWHHDTLGPDYVLMLSDPRTLRGGRFQWFRGTKDEAAACAARGEPLPESRVESPDFPAAGWAVLQQGNMVVHRATKLEAAAERITLVNGYVARDTAYADPCRFPDLKRVDPPHVLYPEWARHKAWIARGRLDRLIAELPFTGDRAAIIAELRAATGELEAAIADIGDESEGKMLSYGG